jgi:hypothetical protein
MMVALLIYSWAHRIFSSRKIASFHRNDVGARILVAEHAPDFRSIHEFQQRHAEALTGLLKQSVKLCRRAGLVSMENVAIDGTKLSANAGGRNVLTYAQITQEEEALAEEIRQFLSRALAEDAKEDSLFGADADGSDLPKELRTRAQRLAKLREAKAALEADARAAEAKRKEKWDATPKDKRPHKKAPDPDTATPKQNAMRSLADPDSRRMKSKSGFLQGYNAQIAVDTGHQIIVGCTVTQEANDYWQLLPVLDQVQANTHELPEYVLADAGYFSEENVKAVERLGCVALVPPESSRLMLKRPLCAPLPEEVLAELSLKERQLHLLSTPDGRERYGLRCTTAEPVFGQIKGSPGHAGFRQFLRRGLENCSVQWHCVCATHNILKYLRAMGGFAPESGKTRAESPLFIILRPLFGHCDTLARQLPLFFATA